MTNQTLQNISQIVVVIGLMMAALGGWGAYFFGQKVQQEKDAQQAHAGKLEPGRKLLLSGKQHIFPKLEFGDSGAIFRFKDNKAASDLFKIIEYNDLTIEMENGQVKISTVIRDKNGHIVTQIVKNEWKVNPNNTWDRNYSKDALEVKDPSGDIVLQVRLVEDRVQLQAKLYTPSGRGIAFGKARSLEGWVGRIETKDPNHPLTMEIQPLFKYPSNLHLGQFLERREHT